MVINFRACEISQGAHKLVWTSILIKKNHEKKNENNYEMTLKFLLVSLQ
jgi:hypothetical protein